MYAVRVCTRDDIQFITNITFHFVSLSERHLCCGAMNEAPGYKKKRKNMIKTEYNTHSTFANGVTENGAPVAFQFQILNTYFKFHLFPWFLESPPDPVCIRTPAFDIYNWISSQIIIVISLLTIIHLGEKYNKSNKHANWNASHILFYEWIELIVMQN